MRHIENNGIIPDSQHGFRTGRSTETSMLVSLEEWTKALDQNLDVDVIFFDFSKAFDRVPFKELIFKLKNINLHPRIVKWISNFITGRSFQVKVNQSFSSAYPVTSGVPQGGVLSPILFIIYTSDLPSSIRPFNIPCQMFADDIKVYKSIQKTDDRVALQSAITAVADWSVTWKLPLSSTKTKFLHLGSVEDDYAYYLHGNQINKTAKHRDLGFILNARLTFDEHCEVIASKADRVIHSLFRGLSTNTVSHLRLAYISYVRPILEYGTTVFNPPTKRSQARLEAVQNNFTRKLWVRLYGYDYTSIPPSNVRNKIFNLSSLLLRRKRNDLLMIYKMITERVSLRPDKFYTTSSSNTRGCRTKIHFPKARSRLRASFFTQRAGSEFLKFSKNMVYRVPFHN